MMFEGMKVIVVRDRLSAGGGICNYYEALRSHVADWQYADVGRPYGFYGTKDGIWLRFTPLRLFFDWLVLFLKILWRRPDVVVVNPCLDLSGKSIARDAVNVWIARLLGRRVVVFWRGWNNRWCGETEFPGGSNGWKYSAYVGADAHIVLASRFEEDLRRWGYNGPIHLESTVASPGCFEISHAVRNGAEILFLSRVEVAKGVFEMVDAFELLRTEGVECTLTIAGDGPDLADLQEYVTGRQIEGIRFCGFVKGEQKMKELEQASLFCFPSYTEGMPNAVLEAMAAGLPIVATDAGGLRDILEEGKTGCQLTLLDGPPKQRLNAQELAGSLRQLLNDKRVREEMGRYNRSLAENRFAAPKVAERLRAIVARTAA